jgi:protein TonB
VQAVMVGSPSGARAGRLIHRVEPVVPAAFGSLRETVVLHAKIGKDGHIRSVKVIGSPNPDLALAASNAVRQWVYEPASLDGRPVEVSATITINFGQ